MLTVSIAMSPRSATLGLPLPGLGAADGVSSDGTVLMIRTLPAVSFSETFDVAGTDQAEVRRGVARLQLGADHGERISTEAGGACALDGHA